jgi:hypothetical protein
VALGVALLAGCRAGAATTPRPVGASHSPSASPSPSASTFSLPATQVSVSSDGFPASMHKPHQDRATPAGDKAKAEVAAELDRILPTAGLYTTDGGTPVSDLLPCSALVLATGKAAEATADRAKLSTALRAAGWTSWTPAPDDALPNDHALRFTKAAQLLSIEVDTSSMPQVALVELQVGNLC